MAGAVFRGDSGPLMATRTPSHRFSQDVLGHGHAISPWSHVRLMAVVFHSATLPSHALRGAVRARERYSSGRNSESFQRSLETNAVLDLVHARRFMPVVFHSTTHLSHGLRCAVQARRRFASGRNWDPVPSNLQINAILDVAHASGESLLLHNDAFSPTGATGPRSFVGVATEEGLLKTIRFESVAKSLPPRVSAGMVELYLNYREAVLSSGVENAREIAVQIMKTVLDRILLQFEEPFTFPSYHKRILDPYDYYAFGQNYVRPLIDYKNSYLGNVEIFDEIESYLLQGHNVFLFGNHQTEADPAVMALLLESKHPYLAENLTYVAGDRVVLDPFCKPFSMGRNLLCVYSKKHIYDEPELVDMKQRANSRTLKEMTAILKQGGQLIWIAPSGGRDRPNPETDEWEPATFDASSVDNMRRLIGIMPVPGHMYPISLLCHNIMPPPRKVEKELGEKRLIGYSGVGLAVASELNFEQLTAHTTTKEEARDHFAPRVFDIVKELYSVLKRAVKGEGLSATSPMVHLSQPWFNGEDSDQVENSMLQVRVD